MFRLKILLTAINAKYIHSNLAVHSLRAAAGSDSVYIREFTINNYVDDILSSIYKEKPDVVAFSCYIWNIGMVEELVDLLHKAAPGVDLWAGGPEVSYDAEDVLQRNPAFTGVMCGEGEKTFALLVRAYEQAAGNSGQYCCNDEKSKPVLGDYCKPGEVELSAIDGIVFRGDDGRIYRTKPQAPVNMDDLPFPYENMSKFENKIIYYESSRGCPFSCSYCLSSIDKHVRFRSMDLVKRELKLFLDYKIPQVKFVDRTFNCSHKRTLELWHFIQDNDNGVTNFHFEITADLLNDEEMDLLAALRPGLVQLEIGVQSTNPATIGAIDRVMDFKRLATVVRRIHQGHNVHQHLDLIAGLPYEDMASFIKSFNDVYSLAPQQLQMGFLKVLKGSKMHRVQTAYDLVYRTKPPYEVMGTRWIDFDDILVLKGVEEMVEVYYNSTQFRLSLKYLLHFFKAPFDLFLELARFYESRGLNGYKHSRLERYEILRRFAMENHFSLKLLESALTFDLYAREKIKSRPPWAYDNGPYKTKVAAFYSSPEMREKYFADYGKETYRQIRNLTHVEVFEMHIQKAVQDGVVIPGPVAVLFDYNKRDPLTYEGKATDLEGDFDAKTEAIAKEAAGSRDFGSAH